MNSEHRLRCQTPSRAQSSSEHRDWESYAPHLKKHLPYPTDAKQKLHNACHLRNCCGGKAQIGSLKRRYIQSVEKLTESSHQGIAWTQSQAGLHPLQLDVLLHMHHIAKMVQCLQTSEHKSSHMRHYQQTAIFFSLEVSWVVFLRGFNHLHEPQMRTSPYIRQKENRILQQW